MNGLKALAILLNEPEVEKVKLLATSKNRKMIFTIEDVKHSGLHINGLELKSDKWMAGYCCLACNGTGKVKETLDGIECKAKCFCDGGVEWLDEEATE